MEPMKKKNRGARVLRGTQGGGWVQIRPTIDEPSQRGNWISHVAGVEFAAPCEWALAEMDAVDTIDDLEQLLLKRIQSFFIEREGPQVKQHGV